MLQCNLDCPFGFNRGADGCPICECQDPCLVSLFVCLDLFDIMCFLCLCACVRACVRVCVSGLMAAHQQSVIKCSFPVIRRINVQQMKNVIKNTQHVAGNLVNQNLSVNQVSKPIQTDRQADRQTDRQTDKDSYLL